MDKPKTINVTQARYRDALQRIANGCLDPVEVAREAIREHRSEHRLDLVGVRFGRLEVIHYAGRIQPPQGHRRSTWLCLCDCGTLCHIEGDPLLSGDTNSCGCLRSDVAKVRFLKHGRYAKKPMGFPNDIRGNGILGIQKAGRAGQAQVLDQYATRLDAAE